LVLLTEMSSVLRERDTTHIEIIDLRKGEDAVGDQFA
jgi:hypothetical protein